MRREAGSPKILVSRLRVLVLTKRHVGSGNEIGKTVVAAGHMTTQNLGGKKICWVGGVAEYFVWLM